MKLFQEGQAREAIDHALNGGQSLHVWTPPKGGWPGAPKCFMKNRERWGHLLDQNMDRLVSTARSLGVRRIVVAQLDRRTQHVDLCGKPLQEAIKKCNDLFGEQ